MTAGQVKASGFTFNVDIAQAAFVGVPPERLVLALLAPIAVSPEWDGCRVLVEPAEGDGGTASVWVTGDAAAAVCRRLSDAFHNAGIPTRAEPRERAPATARAVAEAREGRWV